MTNKKDRPSTRKSLNLSLVLTNNYMILFFISKLKSLNQFSYDLAIQEIKHNFDSFISSTFGQKKHVIFYGTYSRKFVTEEDPCRFSLKIQRIYDVESQTTHALLPTGFVPYSIIPLEVQLEIIDAEDDELPEIRDRYYLDFRTLVRIRKIYHAIWELITDWFFYPLQPLVSASISLTQKQFMQTRGHAFLFSPT